MRKEEYVNHGMGESTGIYRVFEYVFVYKEGSTWRGRVRGRERTWERTCKGKKKVFIKKD